MFSTEEYYASWGFYLLACLGLMLVWWRMTAWIRLSVVRNMLRVSAAVALLMPYPVPEQEAFLAPALMMTFLEGLFYPDYGFAHAGLPLLLAIVLANVLYLIGDLAWRGIRRKRGGDESSVKQAEESEPEERKMPSL